MTFIGNKQVSKFQGFPISKFQNSIFQFSKFQTFRNAIACLLIYMYIYMRFEEMLLFHGCFNDCFRPTFRLLPGFRWPSGQPSGTLPVASGAQRIEATLYQIQCTFFFEPLLVWVSSTSHIPKYLGLYEASPMNVMAVTIYVNIMANPIRWPCSSHGEAVTSIGNTMWIEFPSGRGTGKVIDKKPRQGTILARKQLKNNFLSYFNDCYMFLNGF